MSNFPFNNDKYNSNTNINGCPLSYSELENFSYKIMRWHLDKDTSDWSESNDGFDHTVRSLSFGLAELLSDPNAIKRLVVTGEKVKEDVLLFMNAKEGITERIDNIKKYLNEEFNK